MTPARPSNLERQRWRSKCREELSKHIELRLQVRIEPSHVRLIPGPDDMYRWQALPEKEYLFSKNISDHSIGAYKELCQGVGKTFEAIAPRDVLSMAPQSMDISFTAKISQLQAENARLLRALEEQGIQLVAESNSRCLAEEELERLKDENQQLQEQAKINAHSAESSMTLLRRQLEGLSKVTPILEELRREISLDELM